MTGLEVAASIAGTLVVVGGPLALWLRGKAELAKAQAKLLEQAQNPPSKPSPEQMLKAAEQAFRKVKAESDPKVSKVDCRHKHDRLDEQLGGIVKDQKAIVKEQKRLSEGLVRLAAVAEQSAKREERNHERLDRLEAARPSLPSVPA